MSKNSTLIYFVNKFQADLSSCSLEETDEQNEGYLAEIDVAENAPSEQTIENILNFARSYEVLETQTGYVEMILN